jgi:hypothetical protein
LSAFKICVRLGKFTSVSYQSRRDSIGDAIERS